MGLSLLLPSGNLADLRMKPNREGSRARRQRNPCPEFLEPRCRGYLNLTLPRDCCQCISCFASASLSWVFSHLHPKRLTTLCLGYLINEMGITTAILCIGLLPGITECL